MPEQVVSEAGLTPSESSYQSILSESLRPVQLKICIKRKRTQTIDHLILSSRWSQSTYSGPHSFEMT